MRLESRVHVQGAVRIGSPAHKELFCRMLLDTFDPYRPAVIAWPMLNPEAKARLVGLPIWDIAVRTEGNAALRMQSLADATDDPLIREAIALNAFEERRHKEVLGHMIRFYGIRLAPEPEYLEPRRPLWAFLRTGYGECFDSFFAFGLFALARRSGFFPAELVEVFEPVIQEEARHNLFFVNWLAYAGANRPVLRRPDFALRRWAALAVQVWSRLSLGRTVDGDNFTRTGGGAVGLDLDLPGFMALCLAEHDRRLAGYDPRLLRPRVMPAVARLLLGVLPRPRPARRPAA